MHRRIALAAGLLVCALTSGCTGDEGGYNTELAQRLGEAATALRTELADASDPPAAPQFSASQRRQALAMLDGDLRGLEIADLDGLIAVQRHAIRASRNAVEALKARERALRAAQVDLEDPDLKASTEVRNFVQAYNRMVTPAIKAVIDNQRDMRVAVRSNRDMVRAIGAIREGMQTGQFDGVVGTVRRAGRSLTELARRQSALRNQRPLAELLDERATPLVEQANASAEVSDLVDLLNKRYHDSVLSDILVRPDTS